MFIFTKGIDVMTKQTRMKSKLYGPDTTTEERIKRFVK